MKPEQLKRANEIAAETKMLANKRDQLQRINEKGVHALSLKTFDRGESVFFQLDNNINSMDAIEHQPSSIGVLLMAFVQTSVTVYQRQIDELEKEFNEL